MQIFPSVKTHILIIDRPLARLSKSVLFVEIENDGYTQTDRREPIEGSEIEEALRHVLTYKNSLSANVVWEQPGGKIRSYSIQKKEIMSYANAPLIGRWFDLPNRVVHRSDLPLRTLGDLCDIRDGQSENMASTPGEFTLVVPAADRKTADHWSFEGEAVCVPLVSSAGHGKADIKRLHYQSGKFALANTMCALFVKDEKIVRPRFVYMFLEAAKQELLVPLMSGATNVTMNSSQLADVLIPVPSLKHQDEMIGFDILEKEISSLSATVSRLKSSSNDELKVLSDKVLKLVVEYRGIMGGRASVNDLIVDKNDGSARPNGAGAAVWNDAAPANDMPQNAEPLQET